MRNKLEIFNAQIIYSNFEGLERKDKNTGRIVNDKGNRNFNVILDPEKSEIYWNGERQTDPDFGQTLYELGWNVKIKPGSDEGEPAHYKLPVTISYKNPSMAPDLNLVVNGKPQPLFEDTVGQLDGLEISSADIEINNGKTYIDSATGKEKVKAWCNKGFFNIIPSRLDQRYRYQQEED